MSDESCERCNGRGSRERTIGMVAPLPYNLCCRCYRHAIVAPEVRTSILQEWSLYAAYQAELYSSDDQESHRAMRELAQEATARLHGSLRRWQATWGEPWSSS